MKAQKMLRSLKYNLQTTLNLKIEKNKLDPEVKRMVLRYFNNQIIRILQLFSNQICKNITTVFND